MKYTDWQLFTSNFRNAARNPRSVAICRFLPRGWEGRQYWPLCPTPKMLKMEYPDFDVAYAERLSKLDPHQVLADLGDGAIMLCYERVNGTCHRRDVAEWLERETGIIVPEYGLTREATHSGERIRLEHPEHYAPRLF